MKPLNTSTPHVIMLVGIPGSGKSFFADHFASTFSTPIVSVHQHHSILGDAGIDKHRHDAAAKLMMTHALNELLKTGRTLVYDGYTEAKSDRTFVAQLARQAGYNMLTVWVQTESVSAKSRATRRRRDGGGMSEDEFDAALRRFTTPGVAEKPIVISGKHTYASQLKIVLSRLVVPPAAAPDPTVRVRPATHRVILR